MAEFAAGMGLGLRDSPLTPAWHAVASIARLGCAMVLPALAPAAMIAHWRHAADHAASQAEPRAQLASQGLRLAAGPAALACLGPGFGLTPQVRSVFAEWMGTQLGNRRP